MAEGNMDALFAGVEYDLLELKKKEAAIQRFLEESKSLLIDKFEALVAKQPKKPFLIYDDMIYTYEAIEDMACRVASIAKSWGLKCGDCVAIMIQNEPSFIYTFLGLQKLGISVALINHNLTAHSLIHSISAVDCKALIVGSGQELLDAALDVLPELGKLPVYIQGVFKKNLPPGVASFDDLIKDTFPTAFSPTIRSEVTLMDTCCFIYTSGTTGNPKPVYISHSKTVLLSCITALMVDHNQDDTIYVVLPLYHSTGMFLGLGGTLLAGACLALRKKFSARYFWADCRKYKVTLIAYIGELLRYLVSQPKNKLDGVHNIRAAIGAGLRMDIWNEIKERFKIPKIAEFFGATEGYTGFSGVSEKPGALGRLSPLLSRFDLDKKVLVKFDVATATPIRNEKGRCIPVAVGEPGLLLSRCPDHLLNKKLYKAPSEETEKKLVRDVFVPGDVYMNYGDSFVLDKEYFVYFHDRLGDTYRWKGENVSTKEVANEIGLLPFVEDASVYGVAIPGHDGKAGMAAITLSSNAKLGNKELQELYAHVCKELPFYARPIFVRHIPMQVLTGTFKNKKGDLAKEGFDMDVVKDPLYFLDHGNRAYSPLTKAKLINFLKSKL
ncbi:very long-chain acyl-CoA synthetase [Elysia marginata]|uniref:long-chain-fatty-acid--CoA ligase n=1 Tax=Elysia marginata TaxID=1093978 RepID=A0AAV4JTC5_9GAST|nr:very long-chain acyl-CoA synthetase [Elysia marginata]